MKAVILAGALGPCISAASTIKPKPVDALRDRHPLVDFCMSGRAPRRQS